MRAAKSISRNLRNGENYWKREPIRTMLLVTVFVPAFSR
jgi:hypothetical protein